jgi:hypothetical protein
LLPQCAAFLMMAVLRLSRCDDTAPAGTCSSLKVSAGVKEQFTAVAAAHGLAFGELLERALDAFVREAKRW